MAFKMKYGKGMPFNYGNKNKAALEFNSGLRAASKAGELDDNPKFKNAVDNSSFKKTYAEAYASRDKSVYGDLTQAEYTAEAKKQNKSFKETGKWNAPKTKMKSSSSGPKDKIVTTKRTGGGKKKVETSTDNYQATTKRRKDGTRKKKKTTLDMTNPNSTKFKDKYNKEGDIRKEKMIYTSTSRGEVDVDKTKYNKDGTIRKEITRTRKKGGTGIGQAIKDTLARKKKKREKRRANKGK